MKTVAGKPGAISKSSLMNTGLLVNTVQQLSLAQDLESIMHIVRKVARELTGADGATFVLRDGDQCYYADEDAISPLWKGSRFPMKTCISGWCMLNRKPAIIEDIYADERIPADAYRPTFVKSLAMVPIRTLAPIGAIGNYWAKNRLPSKEEVMMLQSLADITAVSIENVMVRNTLEERVVERTKELSEALEREKELNNTKSAFLSMASHELRTPLTTILSSASIAEQCNDESMSEKRERHFDRIKSSVSNLLDVLDNFLSADSMEHNRKKHAGSSIHLKSFLRDIVDSMDGLCKPGQTISLRYNGLAEVCVNDKILRNIIINLLSNAIKYSDKDISLIAETGEDDITITIKDQGIGIPGEQHQNLFGKFFRANNVGGIQGTGLGLNIVKHYVDLLGGTIAFESKENTGTTFIVKVPVQCLSDTK